jgi:hypothetical protein
MEPNYYGGNLGSLERKLQREIHLLRNRIAALESMLYSSGSRDDDTKMLCWNCGAHLTKVGQAIEHYEACPRRNG